MLIALCILALALGFIALHLQMCRIERERMAEDTRLHARIAAIRAEMSRPIETHAGKSSLDL